MAITFPIGVIDEIYATTINEPLGLLGIGLTFSLEGKEIYIRIIID